MIHLLAPCALSKSICLADQEYGESYSAAQNGGLKGSWLCIPSEFSHGAPPIGFVFSVIKLICMFSIKYDSVSNLRTMQREHQVQ